jgi:hypothetical protein
VVNIAKAPEASVSAVSNSFPSTNNLTSLLGLAEPAIIADPSSSTLTKSNAGLFSITASVSAIIFSLLRTQSPYL